MSDTELHIGNTEPFNGFYKRLLMFVENVTVHDQMSDEEKEMIINVCKMNINH